MVEFNPDGSIKLPGHMMKRKIDDDNKLKTQKCIKVKREVVSFTAPKKCVLRITLSEAITDDRFIENIFVFFKNQAKVPCNLSKVSDKEYNVEIGTDFKRCSDCNNLISRYREFLYGNVIEDKGSCTFEGRNNFCYEDYFD